MSVYSTLRTINVNDVTRKKTGGGVTLTYLSWAWAWAKLKEWYPEATSKVYETDNGCIYHTDGRTCWVKVGVTVEGIEHIEYLPVMDYRNQSIPVDQVRSTDVNKAIQRATVKAIARHGLGLYIYEGEDLPPEDAEDDEIEAFPDGQKISHKESKVTITTGTTEDESTKKADVYRECKKAIKATNPMMEDARKCLIGDGAINDKEFGDMTLDEMKQFATAAMKRFGNLNG